GDVPGGLLEVGHEAPPLEHLRQEVRRALAGEVYAAELGDGVVAVLDEDALVELLGPLAAGGSELHLLTPRGGHAPLPHRPVTLTWCQELVEKQPAQRLRRARVAREQRAPDDLGQVHQREDGTVEVGDVRGEGGALVRRELRSHLESDLSTSDEEADDSEKRALDEEDEPEQKDHQRRAQDRPVLPARSAEEQQERQADHHHQTLAHLDTDVEAEEGEEQAVGGETELTERR